MNNEKQKQGVILFLILYSATLAQSPFSDQIIIEETETDGAHSVYTTDLDGDGDLDVLSASREDDKIYHQGSIYIRSR